MKVFISWSGPTSRAVAMVVSWWLGQILQAATPWMSDREIGAGDRSLPEIEAGLRDAKFGIICVTSENQSAPWLNFEAGAISKEVGGEVAKVAPLLIDMDKPTNLKGPMSQFQAVVGNREGFDAIARAINDALGENKRSESQLDDALNTYWGQLEQKFNEAKATAVRKDTAPSRNVEEIVVEILERVRAIQRDESDDQRRWLLRAVDEGRFEARRERQRMVTEELNGNLPARSEVDKFARTALLLHDAEIQLAGINFETRHDQTIVRLTVSHMPSTPTMRLVQKELLNAFSFIKEVVFSDSTEPLPGYDSHRS